VSAEQPALPRPPVPPGSNPCRLLLAAIDAALRLPYPATRTDEHAYFMLRSKRASLALQAIGRILGNRDADDLDLLAEADILHGQLADYPPSGYAHHPMSS
jgi:hypothetical protein